MEKSKVVLISVFVICFLGFVYYTLGSNFKVGSKATNSNKTTITAQKGNPRTQEAISGQVTKPKTDIKVLVVTIDSNGFSPRDLEIFAGSVVTFTNKDTLPHQVIGDSGFWSSRVLENEDSFSQQFDVAGSYSYSDKLNASFKGLVKVK